MAARSLLSCLSRSLRRGSATIPRPPDRPPLQFRSSQFSRFPQLGGLGHGDAPSRSVFGLRASSSVPNSSSALDSGVACRSLLCVNGRDLGSDGSALGWKVSYSSLAVAVAVEEDETAGLAAEIGYEVLGLYVADGPRIKPQAAFAVVQVGSHQFKVTPGDMIYTEKLKYADINDKLLLNRVLLLGSLKQTIIGRPIIPEAGVLAAVEEIALDEKVIVFKKKRRKNYRRTNGHRQELTRLRILQIEGIEAVPFGLDKHVQVEENPV